MQIIRATHVGLCFGVSRATHLAEQASGTGVVTLGPLMHNPQEVARLDGLGIGLIDRIEQHAGRKVVVRTHGVTREQTELAASLGVDLIDGTCPHVLAPRRKIQAFGRQGRTVLLVGDVGHPEIRAQVSYACGPIHVIRDMADLPDLPADTPVGVVAQTTLAATGYQRLGEEIRRRFTDAVVSNTICRDAHLRQEAGRLLAGQVDLIVVVGGRNSANTTHLAEICSKIQPRTVQLETAEELVGLDLTGIKRVGLTSGASTPEWLIERVELELGRR